jgi:hypothetical protein
MSDLGWVDGESIGYVQCFLEMSTKLEPLQDPMCDLANLIVYSLCAGQVYRSIYAHSKPSDIDVEETFRTHLRLVGQAIVAARLRRLGLDVQLLLSTKKRERGPTAVSKLNLNLDQMRWMILGLVHDREYVTFAEIKRFVDTETGNQTLFHSDFPNIVLWEGLTESAAKSIQQMLSLKKVYLHPATEFTYLADGWLPSLPTALDLREYAEKRWLPTCLHHTKPKE